MTLPTAQTVLAMLALAILGILGGIMAFVPVPASNATLLATIVGALAGALTVAGGQKLADKITSSTGSNATITTDTAEGQAQ
jgi:outer membrane lipoprotein SlyB